MLDFDCRGIVRDHVEELIGTRANKDDLGHSPAGGSVRQASCELACQRKAEASGGCLDGQGGFFAPTLVSVPGPAREKGDPFLRLRLPGGEMEIEGDAKRAYGKDAKRLCAMRVHGSHSSGRRFKIDLALSSGEAFKNMRILLAVAW